MLNRLENVLRGGASILRTRNRIFAGEELELLTPQGIKSLKLKENIEKIDGTLENVVHNDQYIVIDESLPEYSILRRLN